MIGKVNSAGGIKKLVMAKGENSAGHGQEFNVSLTCDFDPLVVVAVGPNTFSATGVYHTDYRLTKNSAWQSDKSPYFEGIIKVSGRTITAGPFEKDEQLTRFNGKILAFGFPD